MLKKNNRELFVSTIFSVALFFAELAYQLFFGNSSIEFSLIRSSAFTGLTLIVLSLFSSIVFKFKPVLARHWRYRRYIGVSGFLFAGMHIFFVIQFYFKGSFENAFFSLNPFENPIVFGALAFLAFLPVALTSSDWAVKKLGGKKWKKIQRHVYLGEYAAIFHFLLINPLILSSLPALVLGFLFVLTVFGQIYWFFKTFKKEPSKKGLFFAVFFLVLLGLTFYFAYFA